ncbi:MAG TPA: class I lanthipeptide [Actinomycetota bacterium]|nr:class I lanthipeptide [Actinomycetota bacterium]
MTERRKLQLHKETLRDLNEADLAEVAGGLATTGCQTKTEILTTTQTPACPSGATWFAPCDYPDS